MTNWVKHTLVFDTAKNFDTFKDYIMRRDTNGELEVDFNTVILMPSALMTGRDAPVGQKGMLLNYAMIEAGMTKTDRLEILEDFVASSECDALRTIPAFNGTPTDKIALHIHEQTLIDAKDPQKYNTVTKTLYDVPLDLAAQYLHNFIKYDYTSWYQWSMDCWNTQWNATDTTIDINTLSFSFSTAEHPVLQLLYTAHIATGLPFTLSVVHNSDGAAKTHRYQNGKLNQIGEI